MRRARPGAAAPRVRAFPRHGLHLAAVLSAVRRPFAQSQRRLHAVLLQRHLHRAGVGRLHRPPVARLAHLQVVRPRRLLRRIREPDGDLPGRRHVQRRNAHRGDDLLFLLRLHRLLGRRIDRPAAPGGTTPRTGRVGVEIRRFRAERLAIDDRPVTLKPGVRGRAVLFSGVRVLRHGGRALHRVRRRPKQPRQQHKRKCAECPIKCHVGSLPHFPVAGDGSGCVPVSGSSVAREGRASARPDGRPRTSAPTRRHASACLVTDGWPRTSAPTRRHTSVRSMCSAAV